MTSTETIRLIRDGETRGREGSMKVGEEGDYIPIATLSPPDDDELMLNVLRCQLTY